jgi:muconolactone delta-isomerase
MKFLVIWELQVLHADTVRAVMQMPAYAQQISQQGKLTARYHMVGKHGGAWLYDVASNEELERLLATAPVYNYARYDVYPLADMQTPADVMQPAPT